MEEKIYIAIGIEVLLLLVPAVFNPLYLIFTFNPLMLLVLYLSPLTALILGVLDLAEGVGKLVG